LIEKFSVALNVEERLLTEPLCILALPNAWHNIYENPRIRAVIEQLVSYDTQTLGQVFHNVLPYLEKYSQKKESSKL